MTEKILNLWGNEDEQMSSFIHISELIVFRHLLDFSYLDIKRKTVVFNGTNRSVLIFPTLKEADIAVTSSLLNLNEMTLLNAEKTEEIEALFSKDVVSFINDGTRIATLVTAKTKSTAQALRNALIGSIAQVPRLAMYRSLDLQCPIIKDINLEKVTDKYALLLESISKAPDNEEGDEEIKNLSQGVANSLEQIIRDLRVRHLGSDWVEIKRDPDLFLDIRRSFEGIKRSWGIAVSQEGRDNVIPIGNPRLP